MKVKLNEEGYIKAWDMHDNRVALGSDVLLYQGEIPEDFKKNFKAYKLIDDTLLLDEDKVLECENTNKLRQLRAQRETECFPVINRGALWYNTLTEEQISELDKWYHAWLDVTETMTPPDMLEWVK